MQVKCIHFFNLASSNPKTYFYSTHTVIRSLRINVRKLEVLSFRFVGPSNSSFGASVNRFKNPNTSNSLQADRVLITCFQKLLVLDKLSHIPTVSIIFVTSSENRSYEIYITLYRIFVCFLSIRDIKY